MIQHLQHRYGPGRMGCWPIQASGTVPGRDLNDLFASVKVIVGDSAFADTSVRYFSDRAFETVSRGGLVATPSASTA